MNEKKWYSNLVWVIIICLSIGWLSQYIVNGRIKNEYKSSIDEYERNALISISKSDSLIKVFELNRDSLNQKLREKNNEIDSLFSVINLINKDYDEQVKIIKNASASDNADWFFSKLKSIKEGKISSNKY